MLMPSHAKNVKLYQDSQPVFTRYGIESQLDAMFSPTVQLRSGGYIVINQTEALVAIDVNSGRSTREHHIEDTALKTNIEASEEVARQLRLRDLAGLIVIDYIDMDEKRNNRTVERRLKDALRNDRARIQVGRISHFGLMEMSRQRIRTSVLESSTEKCPHCGGTGHVRSVSSVALQLLRSIEEMLLKGPTHNLIIRTRPEIALYVLNHKRAHLRGLEERFQITLTVNADEEVGGQIGFTIDRGEQVMTIDQAKALLAQAALAAPALHEDEEPDFAEEVDEESEPEAIEGEHTEHVEHVGQVEEVPDSADDHQPMHADANGDGARENDDGPRDGRGRTRRRRRRGRGGRGGEGRDGRPVPASSRARLVRARRIRARSGARASRRRQRRASRPATWRRSKALRGRILRAAKPHTNGDGEPRRRRRGRRGGRRNRRDGATGQRRFRRDPGSGNPRASRPQRAAGLVAAARGAAARQRGAGLCTAIRARASAGACAAARGCGSRAAARRRTRAAAPPLHGARARAGVQRQRACGDADAGTATARAGRDPARLRPTRASQSAAAGGRSGCSAATRTGLMQSRWVDRDAKAAVDRYAAAGISPELALRVYTTRLLGGDPKLVLHGGGNTSVKLRMPDLLGDEVEVLCVKGSGCRHGARSSPPACRRCGLRRCISCWRATRSPTKTWCACSAPICSIRWRPIRRSRRCCTHSCRTNSSITPMPTPWSAWSIRTNSAELCREVYGDAHGLRALRDAGLPARQGRGRGVRARSEGRRLHPRQARHLHVRRKRARSLRAHDRGGHARGNAAAEKPQGGVRQRADAAAGAAARRHRAVRARRVQHQGRQQRRRVAAADPRFPRQATRSSISSTARTWRATARKASSRRTSPSASRTGR